MATVEQIDRIARLAASRFYTPKFDYLSREQRARIVGIVKFVLTEAERETPDPMPGTNHFKDLAPAAMPLRAEQPDTGKSSHP